MSLTKHSLNLWARRRPVENPYCAVVNGDWEWRILKAYQTRAKEKGNAYARVFCAVRSPYTYNTWDYGDVYLNEIPLDKDAQSVLRQREKEELECTSAL